MKPPASQAESPIVAFIGGGNMARSLIGGMIARGADPARVRVAEPVQALRESLQADFGVRGFATAAEAVAGATVWLLAVKPQVMRAVCGEIATAAQTAQPVAISIAAGITSRQLSDWLGGGIAAVRAMPNTPALLGAGITGLFANPQVDATQRDQAARLLDAVGRTVWIEDEAQMDAVTAVSGSGPAYVFLLAEALQAAGIKQGLPADTARRLANQTLLGAARMLTELDEPAEVLRRKVTSPGGTTQAAIETFEQGGLRDLVDRAVTAATLRGRELSAANDD
ncbi:pyrroline-5-carboxylate reductase [Lysobacter concretionis Ko07 = DSM 16239]|uniref:Pyrroline-5-carboxylate reductase n=1 Tax=Lysobacter concretionis Ko07 = DSM 16239 TaxID=1122185 RepID=A0A0A0EKD6_9GAMM|nr:MULTISPECIES: pyrroline-5-carboxylate reductase [Lysobacter]KGM51431.1 pyrroline-5-carboxylate reductase [Lysobacter concretionis Ko07 = DSM 16239]QOD90511.1 pyrroline-5-carboxylate reductase [Lysobacter sp. CW239]